MAHTSATRRQPADLHVTLDARLRAQIDAEAARAGISRSELVRQLIEDAFARHDEDSALADEALAVLADPNTEWISWEQAKAEYGI